MAMRILKNKTQVMSVAAIRRISEINIKTFSNRISDEIKNCFFMSSNKTMIVFVCTFALVTESKLVHDVFVCFFFHFI